jgi:hypothetical protein
MIKTQYSKSKSHHIKKEKKASRSIVVVTDDLILSLAVVYSKLCFHTLVERR